MFSMVIHATVYSLLGLIKREAERERERERERKGIVD